MLLVRVYGRYMFCLLRGRAYGRYIFYTVCYSVCSCVCIIDYGGWKIYVPTAAPTLAEHVTGLPNLASRLTSIDHIKMEDQKSWFLGKPGKYYINKLRIA